MSREEFLGYQRPDGTVGIRNHLLVLSISGLTIPTARRIASALSGAVMVGMPYNHGSLLGADRATWRRALMRLPNHPNVGAVLLIGDNPPSWPTSSPRSKKPSGPSPPSPWMIATTTPSP